MIEKVWMLLSSAGWGVTQTFDINQSIINTQIKCRYDAAKRKGDYDDESRKRENAKQSLERYMHYFERWDAHQKARNKVCVVYPLCVSCLHLCACEAVAKVPE